MDLRDHDSPWGHVGRVSEVLSFLVFATSPIPDMPPEMPKDAWQGLAWILLACQNTLEAEAARAEKA